MMYDILQTPNVQAHKAKTSKFMFSVFIVAGKGEPKFLFLYVSWQ